MKCLIYYVPELREAIKNRLLEIGFDDLYHQQEILEAKEVRLKTRIGGASQIDRLGEISFGLNCKNLDPLPPNEEWVNPPKLITILSHAAEKLCKKNKKIDVLWSGGIDSSISLLLLKEHAEKDQLGVIMSEGSIDEYPRLYESLIKHMPHVINRELNVRSEMKPDRITVHANEADHLYSLPNPNFNTDLWTINKQENIEWSSKPTSKFWNKTRFKWSFVRYRNLESVSWDRTEIEDSSVHSCESLFKDYDVQRFYISKHLKNEIYFPAFTIVNHQLLDDAIARDILMKSSSDKRHLIPLAGKWKNDPVQNLNENSYDFKGKMELRDVIFELTNDREYAYKKKKISSYWHGQLDAGGPEGRRALPPDVAVCDDGELIRRDQLNDIDPFDFIIP